MPEAPATNLSVIEPSRRTVRAGDVFAYLMPDARYRFGRVVSTTARIGPMEGCYLLYFYDAAARDDEPPLDQLHPDRLLIAPCMTNRLPWTRGYFKTVWSGPLESGATLPQHCFSSSTGKYFDELSRELPGPVGPVGTWGLHSFRTIDDELSRALGFEVTPE